jgi:hypothetical protein
MLNTAKHGVVLVEAGSSRASHTAPHYPEFLVPVLLLASCFDGSNIPLDGSAQSTIGEDNENFATVGFLTTDATIGLTDEMAESTAPDTSSSTGGLCGNGVVDHVGEECDAEDLGSATCSSQGFVMGELGCRADCVFDVSRCIEATCGDNVADGREVCDSDDLGGASCVSQGFDAGMLGCRPDCAVFDTSACISFACGNNDVEGAEVCDVTDLVGESCVSQGYDGGTLSCNGDCTSFDISGCHVCGDDVAEGPELCDESDLGEESCMTQGFDAGTLGCLPDCSGFETSSCDLCGDSTASGLEVCDMSDLDGESCVTQGFDGGTLDCLPDCLGLETSGCDTCGDGAATGPEACDLADLSGQSCVSQGFDEGALACLPDCSGYDISACQNNPVIYCYYNNPGNVPGGGTATHSFTPGQCGGQLPDGDYVGFLSKASQCGGDEDWQVVQANEPGGPGVRFWTPGACAGSDYAVTFVPEDAVIHCHHQDAGNPGIGSNTYTWQAGDCGGILPGASDVGILSNASACGEDTDWRVENVGSPGGPGITWWSQSACSGRSLGAVYINVAASDFGNVRVCSYLNPGFNPPAGNNVYTWAPLDCGGILPPPSHIGGLSAAGQNGGDEDWRVLNVGDPSGPGIAFYVSPSGPGTYYRAVYIEP